MKYVNRDKKNDALPKNTSRMCSSCKVCLWESSFSWRTFAIYAESRSHSTGWSWHIRYICIHFACNRFCCNVQFRVCVCVCRHWHGDAFFSFLNDTSAKHNTQCTDISAKFKSKTRRQCIKRATLVKTMTVKSSSETIQSILQNGANQIELDFYVGMRRIEWWLMLEYHNDTAKKKRATRTCKQSSWALIPFFFIRDVL